MVLPLNGPDLQSGATQANSRLTSGILLGTIKLPRIGIKKEGISPL